MSTPAELVAAVKEDGDFDATDAQALRWLDGRHKIMCQRGRWLRRSFTVTLVALQDTYPLPEGVTEIIMVANENQRYTPARIEDFDDLLASRTLLVGAGGVYGEGVSDEGESTLRIAPVPTEAGELALTALILPPTLTLPGTTASVKIPGDLEPALLAGAVSEGLGKLEDRYDLARLNDEQFSQGCNELLRRGNRRYQAEGPVEIRLASRRR